MNQKEVSDSAIDIIAQHLNERANKPSSFPIITIEGYTETPHYFEIIPFNEIDNTDLKFFAIDGSYNSKEFYNGLSIGLYAAGYVCYQHGKQIRMNNIDDPVILGQAYFPDNILITNDEHKEAILDELIELEPVKKLFNDCFFEPDIEKVSGWTRDVLTANISKLLSFCQEILEWALIFEIVNLEQTKKGDYILKDGALRSNNIKQEHLIKLGKYINKKGVNLVAVTKNSPIKLELASTYKKIDNYLEKEKKPKYPFKTKNPRWQKLCCWFEVPDDVLFTSYPEVGQRKAIQKGELTEITRTSMYAKKGLTGGRGIGLFFTSRLDYVEKLQNYDWVIIDLNMFDCMPNINQNLTDRNMDWIKKVFYELTRLTQEHYILGYPYPLVEAHNFVTLKNSFNTEVIKRVKASLYQTQRMDNVDIENLFFDIHDRF